jgi:hypothetical protein
MIWSRTILNQYFLRVVGLNLMRSSTHYSIFLGAAQNSLFNWLGLRLNIIIWNLSKTVIKLIRVSVIKSTNALFMVIQSIFDLRYLGIIVVSADTSPGSNSKYWILRLNGALRKLDFQGINFRLTHND